MAVSTVDATFRTLYNDEFKFDFERETAKMRLGVRSDGLQRGDTVKWDVVDPGDTANSRARNGSIPISELGLSQVSGTPTEIFKKYRIDKFDEFRNNPNIRSAMSKRGINAINRGIDQAIIDAMDASATDITASTDLASNQAVSLSTLARVNSWMSFLLSADVPFGDGDIFAAISVRAALHIQRIAEIKSIDYVEMKIMPEAPATRVMRWQGVNWIPHNGLTGKGTAACKMYMWHRSAIAHQISGEPESHAYYYEPEDRFECWFKVMHVAKTVLSRGIVRAYHDDTLALTA
jgi:hypothetical protein